MNHCIDHLDAKEADARSPGNWISNCSKPNASPATCAFIRDYQSLVDVARTLGVDGKKPLIAVAVPPPLMLDSAYGMNQSILNDIMPKLVPKIAAESGLPLPIDIFSALGGTAQWRKTIPACGCERPPKTPAPPPTPGSDNFTSAQGFLGLGNNVEVANLTFSEALTFCKGAANCSAFTFDSNSSQPHSKVKVYAKRCHTGVVHSTNWWSWLKPKPGGNLQEYTI